MSPEFLKHLKVFEESKGTLIDGEPDLNIVAGLKNEKVEMGFSRAGLWAIEDADGLWFSSPEAKLLSTVGELSEEVSSPSFRQADTRASGEPVIDSNTIGGGIDKTVTAAEAP